MAPQDFPFGEQFALALTLGSGTVALLLFYFSLIHASSALAWTMSTVCFGAVVSISFIWIRFKQRSPSPFHFAWMPFVLILFLSTLVTLLALKIDLGFDGWSNWGFKAHVVFIEGGWVSSYFAHPWPQFIHHDYPLLLASIEAWAFAFLTRADEHAIKIIFPVFYLGLLWFFYRAASEVRSNPMALIFCVLLGTTPYLVSVAAPSGYADVPLMLYVFGAMIFLRRWFERDNASDLWLGAILAALGVWVKREGIIYWGVNLAAILLWLARARVMPAQTRVRSLTIFLLPAAFIIAPWLGFLTTFQIPPSDFSFGLDPTRWTRLPVIAVNIVQQFLSINLWGGLWIIFFILSLTRWRHLNFLQGYVWACSIVPFIVLQIAFLFSIWDPFSDHMILASDRLCMHEIAIAWYWIALQSGNLDEWLNRNQMLARHREASV